MQHGNISNQQSYVIGFRCENSLLHFKDKSVVDKVLNSVKGRFSRADIDSTILSLMRHIYWNTEYTVMLIIDEKNYTEKAKGIIADLPFNQVGTIIKNVSEVTMMLNTGQLTYFVSDDILDRQLVNSKYAIDSDSFNTILKRQVKRFEKD